MTKEFSRKYFIVCVIQPLKLLKTLKKSGRNVKIHKRHDIYSPVKKYHNIQSDPTSNEMSKHLTSSLSVLWQTSNAKKRPYILIGWIIGYLSGCGQYLMWTLWTAVWDVLYGFHFK